MLFGSCSNAGHEYADSYLAMDGCYIQNPIGELQNRIRKFQNQGLPKTISAIKPEILLFRPGLNLNGNDHSLFDISVANKLIFAQDWRSFIVYRSWSFVRNFNPSMRMSASPLASIGESMSGK
jgi:hypothetical protein